jgi:hypothetical protein
VPDAHPTDEPAVPAAPAAPDVSTPHPHRFPSPSPLLNLDYFAANEPDRRRARKAGLYTACLLLGCVPYLCGIVNALVVAQSYSPTVAGSHRSGAALFMGLGLVLSCAALAGFFRIRQWTGVVASVLLLGLQGSVALCLGLSKV